MGARFVVADVHVNAPGVRLLRHAKTSLQRRVACALHGKLHPCLQQLRQGSEQEVEALLRGQAAHDGEQQRAIPQLKSQLSAQRLAASRFALQPLQVITLTDGGVSGRIPDLRVNAIQDAADMVAATAHHAVEAAAEFMGGDLARVALADGGDLVGVLQARLHEAELAVEFQPRSRQQFRRQAQHRPVAHRKEALEGEVVYCEDRARPRWRVVGHVGASQRGMPVVRMHDVGRPGGVGVVGGQVRRDPAEQGKTLQVVGPLFALVVLIRAAVAPVEIRRVDDVHGQMGLRHARQQQPHAHGTETRADVDHHARRLHGVQHRRQAGQQQPHISALPGQCHWQGRHHVGKAAGLHQRKDFRCHMQHLHHRPLLSSTCAACRASRG